MFLGRAHMKLGVKDLYHRAMKVYNDYRICIPSSSSAALSFYLLILIIPATTLLAIVASYFNVDLEYLERILEQYLRPDYAKMIVDVLNNTRVTTTSIMIIVFSLYAVSRGVAHIYETSKRMFDPDLKLENPISYYGYVFKITFILLLTMMGFVIVVASGPIYKFFKLLYSIKVLQYIIIYGIITLFFYALYLIVPRQRVTKKRYAFAGSQVAAIGIVILYFIFSIYFKYANYQSVYGPLASVVIILFVFNWASEIFYIGMYIMYICNKKGKKNEK